MYLYDIFINYIIDEWNNETAIQMTPGNGMVTLSAVFVDLSITYTWKVSLYFTLSAVFVDLSVTYKWKLSLYIS